jgi:monoamine oxidase
MPVTPAVGVAVEDTFTVENAERVDVCIIGAGLAGLACARQLVRRGIRVCVVEARDRVGGRSYSPVDEAFGDVIDLGGQFFGGRIQPLTLDLIHELGLESQLEPQAFFGDGPTAGGSISLGAADAADYVGLEAEIEALSAVVTAPSGEGEEWLVGGSSARARELDAISVARWVATRQAQGGLGTAAAREFLLLVQTVLAADPEQLSFLGLLSFFQACGGMAKVGDGPSGAQAFRLKGGAQRIADEAAAALVRAQGPGVLRLSSAVTTVAYSLSGAHVEVRCVHGTVVCRAAVIAVPPPLWSGGVNFEPPLPPAKSTVASQLVRGRAVKVVVAYESNFWTGAPAPPAALEELGPIANLFPSSVGGKPALVGLATGSAAAALGALTPPQWCSLVVCTVLSTVCDCGRATACCTLQARWVRASKKLQ